MVSDCDDTKLSKKDGSILLALSRVMSSSQHCYEVRQHGISRRIRDEVELKRWRVETPTLIVHG